MNLDHRLTLVMIADVPGDTVDAFRNYESKVLPLLARHQGHLERRLRSGDGRSEVHVLSFETRANYQSFLADPERLSHRGLLDGAEIAQRVIEVSDV